MNEQSAIIDKKSRRNLKRYQDGESVATVQIPVIFTSTFHSDMRSDARNIDKEFAKGLIIQATPKIVAEITRNELDSNGGTFVIIDKQSCYIIACTVMFHKNLIQQIDIHTFFKHDGKHHPPPGKKIILNNDNPSEEWNYYEQIYNDYKNVASEYRAFEKLFDPYYKCANKKRKNTQINNLYNINNIGKEEQINQLWNNYYAKKPFYPSRTERQVYKKLNNMPLQQAINEMRIKEMRVNKIRLNRIIKESIAKELRNAKRGTYLNPF